MSPLLLRLSLIAVLIPFARARATGDMEPPSNDAFESRALLQPPLSQLTGVIAGPVPWNSVLGSFAQDCDPQMPVPVCAPTHLNDDYALPPAGDSRSSAIFAVPVNPDGVVRLRVSGSPDESFTGGHAEAGDYTLFVEYYGPASQRLETQSVADSLGPREVDSHALDAPPGALTFTAYLDNVGDADRIDFLSFVGLEPGADFAAQIRAPFDVVLGQFRPDGSLKDDAFAENSGAFYRATLLGQVSPNGTVTLAVTEFDDLYFAGDHQVGGPAQTYDLAVQAPVRVSAFPAGGGVRAVALVSLWLGALRVLRTRRAPRQ